MKLHRLPLITALAALSLTGAIFAQSSPTMEQAPEKTPEATAEIAPEATAEPTPVTEYPGARRVDAGRISFLLPGEVANDILVTEVEAVPLHPDGIFGDSLPAHTQISFVDYLPDDAPELTHNFFATPVIYVFDTADFAAYEAAEGYGYESELGLLQGILDGTVRRSRDTVLPYLPVLNAAQIFRAREEFVRFNGGSGIAYLTTFGHDVTPVQEGGVQWTMQGLSDDGSLYIAAIFPIDTGYFPHEIEADFDYAAFVEEYEQYFADVIDGLEAQPDDAFAPRLDALSALVGSIELQPTE